MNLHKIFAYSIRKTLCAQHSIHYDRMLLRVNNQINSITHRNNYLFHVKSDFSLYSMPFTYRVDVFFSMLYERIILKLSIYPCYRCIRDQNLVTMSYTLSIVH